MHARDRPDRHRRTLLDAAADARVASSRRPPQPRPANARPDARSVPDVRSVDRSPRRAPVVTLVVVALMALVAVAVAAGPSDRHAAARPPAAVTPPVARVTTPPPAPHAGPGPVALPFGGRQRSYLLEPAVGLPPGQPAALLVVLHQDNERAVDVASSLGFDPLRRQGVTLVYPSGVGGTWDAGTCCGPAQRAGLDDVGFVNAVLDDVGRRTPVDNARRAVLGYSGGAMLLYRLLCSPHVPIAAAVDVNGSLQAPCVAPVALPDLLSLHGALDGTIRLRTPVFVRDLGVAPTPTLTTLARVTAAAGCAAPRTQEGPAQTILRWDGCRGGHSVDAVLVSGAGHDWRAVGGASRSAAWLLARLRPR